MSTNLALGTGRRKTSVARVFLREGEGKMTINGRDVKEYFHNKANIYTAMQPLAVTDNESKYDILISVKGGGFTGQAGAIMHGLSRALCVHDQSNYSALRANGFLTRDSRMVERKKYGQSGARKKFQFSKR